MIDIPGLEMPVQNVAEYAVKTLTLEIVHNICGLVLIQATLGFEMPVKRLVELAVMVSIFHILPIQIIYL